MAKHKILFVIVLTVLTDAIAKDLKLKTVLALSRHNIRTPYMENLQDLTPKQCPEWDKGPSFLTDKGKLLEGYIAEYFYQWLRKEEVLTEECPDEDTVYIYANTRPRTKDTAEAFAKYAFKNCNTSVHYLNIEEMDPVFNPVIHNTSEEFKKLFTAEMESKINELDLTDAFEELNRITGLNESQACKKGYCDFSKVKNTVWYEVGEELNIDGPLREGNAIVDIFIMSYYDGKPENEVAWGEITTPEQWGLLTKISKENQNVRFNLTTASRDIAGPLLKYMSKIFLDDNSTRKFTLLVGHDSNINPVMNVLQFEPYFLPNQYEPYPIGGKLVFEKWSDGITDFLKIEYIYQSWSQLRDGAKLNSDNPPERVVLELKGCKTNENGFCLWNDFVKVLNEVI